MVKNLENDIRDDIYNEAVTLLEKSRIKEQNK